MFTDMLDLQTGVWNTHTSSSTEEKCPHFHISEMKFKTDPTYPLKYQEKLSVILSFFFEIIPQMKIFNKKSLIYKF